MSDYVKEQMYDLAKKGLTRLTNWHAPQGLMMLAFVLPERAYRLIQNVAAVRKHLETHKG